MRFLTEELIMSLNANKNIKSMVRAYFYKKIVAALTNFKKRIDRLTNRQVIFTGDTNGVITNTDKYNYKLTYINISKLGTPQVFTEYDSLGVCPYVVATTQSELASLILNDNLPVDKVGLSLIDKKFTIYYNTNSYEVDYTENMVFLIDVPLHEEARLLAISNSEFLPLDSNVNILNSDYESVVKLNIENDSHIHTAQDISGVVDNIQKFPNSIVKRNSSGATVGSGSKFGDTGFLLSNSEDITTLFRNVEEYPFSVTSKQYTAGNRIYQINLSMTDKNEIKLDVWGSNLCPWNGWACNCCS